MHEIKGNTTTDVEKCREILGPARRLSFRTSRRRPCPSCAGPPVRQHGKLITDQIFVKGAGVTDFPFDWKGELSALNVEACSGK